MEQLKPEVVVIDESVCLGNPVTVLMRYLAGRPGAKVIGVDLRENSVRVLSSEERAIDLI